MTQQGLKAIYVVRFRKEGEWTVVREGNQRPSSLHPNQKRAEAAAIKLAKRQTPAKVVIHAQDGSVARELAVDPVSATKGVGG